MILLNATDISKSYTASPLLSNLSYAINEGDKIGLIGVNGTGKSTLLRITAGIEDADSGKIILTGGVRIGYLPQAPAYDPEKTVLEQAVSYLTREIAAEGEYKCKSMLNQLGITDFEKKMNTLSGGERKRVAMAGIFTNECDILILDEPTNHIDSDTVEWLENYLKKFRGAIFMVTHDRYFLDRVTNVILELTGGRLYRHEGNYEVYLENRAAREEMVLATERKRRTLYRRELEWMRRGAQARTTKAKGRIDRFHQLEESKLVVNNAALEMKSVSSRLGKKIIELEHVSKAFDGVPVISDFSYTVLRNDRIGIIGENGSGKSTLLKLISGELQPDSGSVEIGETVKIGYFSQENEHMDKSRRVIEYICDIAHNVKTEDGYISASQMLERFLFPPHMHSIPVGRLSGGEQRRLYLLGILMSAPNVLLLDEPTNDLDIDTLCILEDYLDSFAGAVIAVSHDRHFIDRIAEKTFVYEGEGHIAEYPGGYSDWVERRAAGLAAEKNAGKSGGKTAASDGKQTDSTSQTGRTDAGRPKKLKFSYKEQREFETIDEDIAALESAIEEVDGRISEAGSDYCKLQELTAKRDELTAALDEKMERWVYLNDLAEKIEAQKSQRVRELYVREL
ncbi:aTPase components of ABC transporters with duplicated ATPase domains [Firmicutes bacterium CAG:238]|nr:aTPase components of ABC transporters with duplicated ATPase domains [Firmicutes bacterium CAG:238]